MTSDGHETTVVIVHLIARGGEAYDRIAGRRTRGPCLSDRLQQLPRGIGRETA